MRTSVFERAEHALRSVAVDHPVGRITQVSAGTMTAAGLPVNIRVGDTVEIGSDKRRAEVIKVTQDSALLLPEGPTLGTFVGEHVVWLGAQSLAPDWSWIGRVIDPHGQSLDGRPILPGLQPRHIMGSPPMAYARRTMGQRLNTGYVLFDTMLPVVQGQRIGLFAGSGVGKSTLLGGLAHKMTADITVIALVGERGREVREFVENTLGPEGLERSIVVAATSDRAPQVRRKCVFTATAVAEFFRDQGLHVLLLVDSVTRFAEAHRETSVAAGEAANLRGYPASTASAMAGLCERAGPGEQGQGDITAIYSVLVAGSDMEEPIADTLRGLLDGHVVMDRKIAESGRYPAVDVLRSVSRSLPHAATQSENNLISQARELLGAYDRTELMLKAGLYEAGSDPVTDRAIELKPKLDTVLGGQSANAASSFAKLRSALS